MPYGPYLFGFEGRGEFIVVFFRLLLWKRSGVVKWFLQKVSKVPGDVSERVYLESNYN